MKRWFIHNLRTGRAWLLEGETRVGRRMMTLAEDPLLSQEHFSITVRDGDAIWIVDLGSRNGTIHNGSFLEPGTPARLAYGDEIQAGGQVFRIYPSAVLPRGREGLFPVLKDTLTTSRAMNMLGKSIVFGALLYVIMRLFLKETGTVDLLPQDLFKN